MKEEVPLSFLSQFNDFKAEVTAAEMVEQGVPEDRILILMLGAMKRSFRKDVESIEEELSEYDHKEYVLIKTPKEGIYDMLPEGLFHHPSSHKSANTEKEIIKAIKQRKEEERTARKFFLPFEATINYLRMQMALYENRLDKRTHYDELVNIFRDEWEIFRYLDTKQADFFLHLIPILHDIRDDYPVIETVMEMIFELPVEITLRPQLPLRPAEPILSQMGDSILGVDLTTSNALYNEGVDELLIKIGPMTSHVFQQFMPGGSKYKILELLSDYLLPVHLDIVTEFELYNQERVMRFADSRDTLNSVLGADTYL
jgi:type VI secretion system protein ImpH